MHEAITKKGTKVWIALSPDTDENEGGWFVEVYLDPNSDYYDYFCIHPEDCDCSNMDEVIENARWFLANAVTEY